MRSQSFPKVVPSDAPVLFTKFHILNYIYWPARRCNRLSACNLAAATGIAFIYVVNVNWCDLKKRGGGGGGSIIGQEHLADPTNRLIILKTRLNANVDKNEKNSFSFQQVLWRFCK